MKLRNKKTGEIMPVSNIAVGIGKDGKWYDSLAELNEDWEDYEEPKPQVNYYMSADANIRKSFETDTERNSIGNCFLTEEEAERAVKKLKAWQRLKDKPFKFYGWNKGSLLKGIQNNITFDCDDTKIWTWEDIRDDLDLLFGGEE